MRGEYNPSAAEPASCLATPLARTSQISVCQRREGRSPTPRPQKLRVLAVGKWDETYLVVLAAGPRRPAVRRGLGRGSRSDRSPCGALTPHATWGVGFGGPGRRQ